jgi:hypothetical protein
VSRRALDYDIDGGALAQQGELDIGNRNVDQ